MQSTSFGLMSKKQSGELKAFNEEERTFMNRFRKNFGKIFKQPVENESTPIKLSDDMKESQSNKELEEIRERMNKIESMFSRILLTVDKIGNDISKIKDN